MPVLSERDQRILAALIEQHIATAEPVSSQQLCVQYGFKCSSATVRNILARLEAEGFLNHPYTSAGKIPTVKAYRYLVEKLLSEPAGRDHRQRQIRFEILEQTQEIDKIVRLTAKVLAVTSQLLAVTWLSSGWEERLARIQLVRLASRRILLIVYTLAGEEFHEVFTLEKPVGVNLMQQVSQLVNQHGQGKTASELEALAQIDWADMDRRMRQLFRQALYWAGMNLHTPGQEELVIEGTSNLIHQPEFNNISATRQLVTLLDQRDEVIRSFEAPGIERQGIRVVIGDGPWAKQLPALSLVAEEISLNVRRRVRIGVIGPRRMAYNRIIPLVKCTAAALTKAVVKR